MVMPFSAVLLAAGRSTRMGRDKALLDCAGLPLWRRQQDVLRAAGAVEVFLSARDDQKWAYQAPGFTAVLHDALPDCGPIVGLTAALERATHPHVAALAIDLPHLPAVWFEQLAADCTVDTGMVGRTTRGYEPLAAVYPTAMKWLAWEAIAAGSYSLQALLDTAARAGLLRTRDITAAEAPWFHNVNTPEDAQPA